MEINGSTQQKSVENTHNLHLKLLKRGVLAGRGSAVGNVLRIQPPMCIETHDVEQVIDSLWKIASDFTPK